MSESGIESFARRLESDAALAAALDEALAGAEGSAAAGKAGAFARAQGFAVSDAEVAALLAEGGAASRALSEAELGTVSGGHQGTARRRNDQRARSGSAPWERS